MGRRLLKGTAICIDVGAPLVATLTQFPLWIARSAGATVSGIFLLFAILSAGPLFKHFGKFFKTPSAPMMWGLIFAFLMALRAIIEEMLVISFVGVVSNAIGWALFKLAGEGKTEKTGNSQINS